MKKCDTDPPAGPRARKKVSIPGADRYADINVEVEFIPVEDAPPRQPRSPKRVKEG